MPVAAEPAPRKQNRLSLEGPLRDAGGGLQAREHDGGRTLDVVVETEHAFAILAQQRVGVGGQEVLELDERARKHFLHAHDELLHELRVGAPAETLLTKPEIERVHAHRVVVGANVQHDGQAHRRIDSRARRVERQLAHWDAHTARTEVTEPEDALAIGDDDDLHPGAGPVPQHLHDPASVGRTHVEATGAAKDVGELATRFAHRRRVDDGHHLFDVVDDGAEEESFVPILKRVQIDVALQIGRLRFVVLQDPPELLVLGEGARRNESSDPQRVAFGLGEAGSLVEQGVVENVHAAPRHFPSAPVPFRVVHRATIIA